MYFAFYITQLGAWGVCLADRLRFQREGYLRHCDFDHSQAGKSDDCRQGLDFSSVPNAFT